MRYVIQLKTRSVGDYFFTRDRSKRAMIRFGFRSLADIVVRRTALYRINLDEVAVKF